jgi:hypothetical protein
MGPLHLQTVQSRCVIRRNSVKEMSLLLCVHGAELRVGANSLLVIVFSDPDFSFDRASHRPSASPSAYSSLRSYCLV